MFRNLILCALMLILLAACDGGGSESSLLFEDLPAEGDITRGAQIFNEDSRVVATCTACHNANATGAPTLADYGSIAGERVAGESAREYTFYAITAPARHITEGYANAMPARYDEEFSAQDIADLIAYLLSL